MKYQANTHVGRNNNSLVSEIIQSHQHKLIVFDFEFVCGDVALHQIAFAFGIFI